MIHFFVPGKPIGKGRPRVCRNVTYTPKKTRDYETLVKSCYKQKYGNEQPITSKIPVTVLIYAYFATPKNMPKSKLKLIEENKLFPTVKPDADNISKIILDALNGLAYYDDNQVIDLVIHKEYATTDEEVGVFVVVREKRLLYVDEKDVLKNEK